jgi:3-hydroxyisobutyrate dehydrogenase-like beta-hydroxyacid dehydrogenase
MGSAIGGHLLERGWAVVATDPSPQALDQMESSGAQSAAGAAEVASRSDLVLVVVVDDEQVRDAIAGPSGALVEARPGTIIAICASVRPDTCRAMAASGARHGVHVIDVALVRGERGAEEADLALFCGGGQDVIDACRPVFAAFASDVCLLGEVGSGQIAKAANNILLWACIRADLEAQRLARALGLEPSRLRSALATGGSGANKPLAEWGLHRLRWPQKDLQTALELAEGAGVEMPFVKALAPLMGETTVEDLHAVR